MLLAISDLRTDGGTQPRGRLDDSVVARYAEDMAAALWDFGASSAPITAFFDGETHWLADGYHRLAAATKAGLDQVEVDVRQGSQRDAILFSVGANATHGHPRSNDDKRRAVSRLLDDPEWSTWSDREIARRCSVTHPFVSKLRSSLETVTSERTYTTKHGTVAKMDTTAIGGNPNPPLPPAPPAASHDEWLRLMGEAREAEQAAGAIQAAAGGRAEPVGERRADDPRGGDGAAEAVSELRSAPVGAWRVAPDPPGASHGKRTYLVLKAYLDAQRPSLPSREAVEAMTVDDRRAIRGLVDEQRTWAASLIERIDTADAGGD